MTKYTVIQSYSSDAFGSRYRGDVFETDNQNEVQELLEQGFVVEGEHDLAREEHLVTEAYREALNNASQQAQQLQREEERKMSVDYKQVEQQASQLAQAQSQIMRDSMKAQEQLRSNAQQHSQQQRVNAEQVEPQQVQTKITRKSQANENK